MGFSRRASFLLLILNGEALFKGYEYELLESS